MRRYEIEAQRHLDSALQARLRMALSFFGCSMSVLVAPGSCITLYNSFAAWGPPRQFRVVARRVFSWHLYHLSSNICPQTILTLVLTRLDTCVRLISCDHLRQFWSFGFARPRLALQEELAPDVQAALSIPFGLTTCPRMSNVYFESFWSVFVFELHTSDLPSFLFFLLAELLVCANLSWKMIKMEFEFLQATSMRMFSYNVRLWFDRIQSDSTQSGRHLMGIAAIPIVALPQSFYAQKSGLCGFSPNFSPLHNVVACAGRHQWWFAAACGQG